MVVLLLYCYVVIGFYDSSGVSDFVCGICLIVFSVVVLSWWCCVVLCISWM